MEEIIWRNEDGNIEYDCGEYFTLDEALLAEWRLNSLEMERSVLSELMEKIWDKKSICTDGKGRLKEQRWEAYVDAKIEQLKALEKPCVCQQLISKIRPIIAAGKPDMDTELFSQRVYMDDGGRGPAIAMLASVDGWTKKRIYFSMTATEEGESFTDDIKFCPFCGRPLDCLTVDDFRTDMDNLPF